MRVNDEGVSLWPAGFERVPGEEWTCSPIEALARNYDSVENHGWYRNLDPTVRDLTEYLRDGHLLLDYSGGTGILAQRLLQELPGRRFGILIADSSPKFLRLALEKLGGSERLAFRLIHYLKSEKRLQLVEEAVGEVLVERGVDAIVSTNAIHLYYDLEDTLRSWRRVLRPGGRVFVQSGNIGRPDLPAGAWIIDETVEAIHRQAMEIVRRDAAWAAYRGVLSDAERLAAYDGLRRKFFLPVRPLSYYLETLRAAGFEIVGERCERIEAAVGDWRDFLAAYHEGVLGWIGGSARIEGAEPAADAVRDRQQILTQAMHETFEGRDDFDAAWTYITAR